MNFAQERSGVYKLIQKCVCGSRWCLMREYPLLCVVRDGVDRLAHFYVLILPRLISALTFSSFSPVPVLLESL